MEDAAAILVIITSTVLCIFLILSIVLVVYLVKLVKSLRRISDKAEDLIDSAEAVTDAVMNVKGPIALLKMLQNIVSMVNEGKDKNKKK